MPSTKEPTTMNDQRPTPETDEQEEMDNGDTVPLLDFARKLERERDEARDALSGRTVSCSQCNQTAVERDEARELARELLNELVWKGKLVGLTKHQQALIAKAKEVLP